MNNKGNIRLAYKVFEKDLQKCPDFIKFKEDSIRIVFEDRLVRERNHIGSKDLSTINVLKPNPIRITFNVPQVYTKKARKLNKLL
jgi:hypothetical protein